MTVASNSNGGAVDYAPAGTLRVRVRTAALLRVAEVLPCPVAMALGASYHIEHLALAATTDTVLLSWSALFVVRALRTGSLPDRMMLADVVIASLCLMASGRAVEVSYSTGWSNPAVAPAVGCAIAAAVVWWRLRAVLAALALALSYLFGVLPALRLGGPPMTAVVGNVLSLVVFTVVAGTISNMLMRHAETIRSTTAAMLAERERVAEQRARYDERSRQYRMLHDTVLSTLNSIARGAEQGPRLRERCAADADLIRGMISADPRAFTGLAGELALVIRDQSALGLRVHRHLGDLPDHLPPAAVSALAGACREALNNVIKHAGAGEAWVTATAGPDGTVTVTVVDRGRGLPRPFTPGLGLTRSVAARMAEAGGGSTVDGEPGQGTCVELTWPR